jgi:pyruvate kinase
VVPRQVKFEDSLDDKIKTARQEALMAGVGKKGDIIVVTAGPLGGVPKTTNLIQVEIV